MNFITLKRSIAITHNINELFARNCTVKNTSDKMNVDYTNIWLRFVSMNETKIHQIVTLAILLIITQDKSVFISGEKIKFVINLFGKHNYLLARTQTFLCPSIKIHLPILQVENFTKLSHKILTTRIYEKHLPSLTTEIYLNTKELIDEANIDEITKYWIQYSTTTIETALIRAFKLKCPQTFALNLS